MAEESKALTLVGFRRIRVVVVDVSTPAEVRPQAESEAKDLLSSLLPRACLFQAMASLGPIPSPCSVVLAAELEETVVVELGQWQEMRQCFLHNLTTKSH